MFVLAAGILMYESMLRWREGYRLQVAVEVAAVLGLLTLAAYASIARL